ncbi:MAG: hypothetical protein ABGX47_08295 [Martelella sp.]|uniref:hypothetical protein n=1 Tax=Martelella sp. TaxID=1969699 RepID=UPI00324212BE
MKSTNHVKKPFFEAPPARVQYAIDTYAGYLADCQWLDVAGLYGAFVEDLKRANVEAPSFQEYLDWAKPIRAGAVRMAYPYHPQVKSAEERKATEKLRKLAAAAPTEMTRRYQKAEAGLVFETVGSDYGDGSAGLGSAMDELAQAEAIVKAAHKLNEAKLAAGYSPLSLHSDDTIVAEAIRTVISERQTPIWGLTPASTAVDLLLSQCDDEIDGAVLDALSMDLQHQLCAALANEPAQEGGAS